MKMSTAIAAAGAALMTAAPLSAQAKFQDIGELDVMVAAYLGAPAGQPGGATAPIDRRLRLTQCPGQVAIDVPTARYATVRCDQIGWRIRVPVSAMGAQMTANQSAPVQSAPVEPAQPMVLRNTMVQLIIERPGFSVTTQATALTQGSMGELVRVRLDDSRTVRSARVSAPGRATLIE